jgi:hypothetical protein
MNLTFKRWLFNQKERKDQIGKLALAMEKVDYSYIKPRRKPDEHKKWAKIVTRHGRPEHVPAFNRAWREYLTAKQEVVAQT